MLDHGNNVFCNNYICVITIILDQISDDEIEKKQKHKLIQDIRVKL